MLNHHEKLNVESDLIDTDTIQVFHLYPQSQPAALKLI